MAREAAQVNRATRFTQLFAITSIKLKEGLHYVQPFFCFQARSFTCSGANRLILELLSKHNIQPQCLGITKSGYPRHPLYVMCSQKSIVY